MSSHPFCSFISSPSLQDLRTVALPPASSENTLHPSGAAASVTRLSPCHGLIALASWTVSTPPAPPAPGSVTFSPVPSQLSPCTTGFPGCPHLSPPQLPLLPALCQNLKVHVLSYLLMSFLFFSGPRNSLCKVSTEVNELQSPPRPTALLLPGTWQTGLGSSSWSLCSAASKEKACS